MKTRSALFLAVLRVFLNASSAEIIPAAYLWSNIFLVDKAMAPFHYHGNKYCPLTWVTSQYHVPVYKVGLQGDLADLFWFTLSTNCFGFFLWIDCKYCWKCPFLIFCPQTAPEYYRCTIIIGAYNTSAGVFDALLLTCSKAAKNVDQQSQRWRHTAACNAVTQHLPAVSRTASSVICLHVDIMGSVECTQVAQEKNLENNSLIGLTVMH